MTVATDPHPGGQGRDNRLSQPRHHRRSPCRHRREGRRMNRQFFPRRGMMQDRAIMVVCKSIGDVARACEPKFWTLLAAFASIAGDRELYRGGAR
ncbi:hypothetical protein [Bosea sp. BIWAKO-01]|uniref:hypothetical protein n=1 Tax=Bosea sp. BIWAKO-01 TaxID=506668 RepID=UPI00086B5FA1|nr:hypothetical protein [Bosea sp. BIWAKO-01]GAU86006.1 hypothetical protein BIWAKO_05954 [Bosea sp. BIWAKO-01]